MLILPAGTNARTQLAGVLHGTEWAEFALCGLHGLLVDDLVFGC